MNIMKSDLINRSYALPIKMKFKEDFSINEEDINSESLFIPPEVKDDCLARISQLSLKEIWLGETPGNHTRWIHSTGVFNVGYIWLKVLNECNRIPKHCLPRSMSWSDILCLANHALLLHDYGHLPFSHLLGEILSSINWIPIAGRWGGLEVPVIQKRLAEKIMNDTWNNLASETGKTKTEVRSIIEELIIGVYSIPWLQTIINSPLDADKIDYIRYDSELLQNTNFPLRTRIQHGGKPQWLEEFLQEQQVNHAGFLCLHGRSARAAADLWRDRIFLYDRFYMSPELRVPERMASEIIQQFIIRSTMSDEFWRFSKDGLNTTNDSEGSFPAQMSSESTAMDPIKAKYEVVQNTMLSFFPSIETGQCEFDILKIMFDKLKEWLAFNHEYIDFLEHCFGMLDNLKNKSKTLREVVDCSLVCEPMLFNREDYNKAREIIRPLQHIYSCEALIDIIRLPYVLATPRRWCTGFGKEDKPGLDYSVLVPDGPVSSWGPGKMAKRPLTDECVEELERPYCRILVISPDMANSAQAKYIYDRVRSVLLEANIEFIKYNGKDGR
jgi:HD superfamily phosphohydrolase